MVPDGSIEDPEMPGISFIKASIIQTKAVRASFNHLAQIQGHSTSQKNQDTSC